MPDSKIGFIGCGNMAYAIINGIISTNMTGLKNIYIYDIDSEKMAHFALMGIKSCESTQEIMTISDVVFLCIKPQDFVSLALETQHLVANNKIFVSIMAGISSAYIREQFAQSQPVIRIMPNAPLMLGMGASAICKTDNVPADVFSFVCDIFSVPGKIELIDELLMDSIVPVNGSSPAFIYLFAQAVVSFAVSRGISDKKALNLFCQTLVGSAEMLLHSGKTPEELIKMVSSKGGATIAALSSLENDGFTDMIISAMASCELRAKELGALRA